jgi:hypothetical protein
VFAVAESCREWRAVDVIFCGTGGTGGGVSFGARRVERVECDVRGGSGVAPPVEGRKGVWSGLAMSFTAFSRVTGRLELLLRAVCQ